MRGRGREGEEKGGREGEEKGGREGEEKEGGREGGIEKMSSSRGYFTQSVCKYHFFA